MDSVNIEKIQLDHHQIKAYDELIKLYNSSFVVINTGCPGWGKTVWMLYFAVNYNYTLLVICPKNVELQWHEEAARFGAKIITISYSMIGGKSNKINHPYLSIHNGQYMVTNEFIQLLSTRIVLVFDEAQEIKNPKSQRSEACQILSKEIVRINNGSRIAILSNTPFDKEIFVESIIKIMGIVTTKLLFFYNVGIKDYQIDGYGYKQFIDYCSIINPSLTKKLIPHKLKSSTIKKSIYEMYVQIIKPKLVVSTPDFKISSKFIPKIKYYKLDPISLEKFNKGINDLKNAIHYADDGTFKYTNDNIGKDIVAYEIMENAKVEIFIKNALDILNYSKYAKLIIYVWHDSTVNILIDSLRHFNPLRCDGKVDPITRFKYRQLFNLPTTEYRLIIAKPTAFGQGISLHDTNGNFPRYTIINPNFSYIKIKQSAGRTYRVGSKSDSYCILAYARDTDEERIINALIKKDKIVQQIVYIDPEDENINSIPFPSDWPIEYE